jgi:hypothetical protein
MKPPCGSLIEKCRAHGKADHFAGEQHIQHLVYMYGLALVDLIRKKLVLFWAIPRATSGRKLLHDAIARAKGL